MVSLARTYFNHPQYLRVGGRPVIVWYLTSTPGYAGYGSRTRFLADAAGLLKAYREALDATVPIVPSVMPGYNDRGVRLAEDHPAIPRQWAPGDPGGSFLRHMLDDVALPAVDPRVAMVMINSWNEWNEDTAIEPVALTASTTTDDSATGSLYTQGYRYGGSGTPELDVVRDVARARVPGPKGCGGVLWNMVALQEHSCARESRLAPAPTGCRRVAFLEGD